MGAQVSPLDRSAALLGAFGLYKGTVILLLHLLKLGQKLLLLRGDLGLPAGEADLLGGPPLLLNLLVHLGLGRGIGSDGSMSVLVHALHAVSSDSILDEPAEVLLELLLVLLLQRLHVLRHVETEDVLSVHVGVQLLALGVVTGESLLGVGDVQSSVNSALQGSEHLGSGGSPGQSNIQASPECSGSIVLVLHVEHGAVDVGVALVDSVQLELLEDSPSQQQPGAVGSGVVGESDLDSPC